MSVQIRWRDRSTGRWASETFRDQASAARFQAAVEAAGDRWPRDWMPGAGWKWDHEAQPTRLDEVFQSWLEWQRRRVELGRVKSYTVHRYQRDYERHIAPRLGALPFAMVTTADLESWLDGLLEAGLSPKTARNVYGAVLAPVLKHGVHRLRLRADIPSDGVELPRRREDARQVRFLTRDEWRVLRACLKPDVVDLCDTLLATGLRWGEITALTVGDVHVRDNDTVHLHVRQAWTRRGPEEAARPLPGETTRWVLASPKNGKSRWVTVHGPLAARLQAAVVDRSADSWVFATAFGKAWRYPDFHSERWTPAVNRAAAEGLQKRVTPHMLRHTAVVWALEAGVKLQVVSHALGHASIQTTYDIYGGLMDLHDPEMARALAQMTDL